MHGDNRTKLRRWNAIKADFDSEIATGTKKSAAYAIVAEKRGVSSKTVGRIVNKYLKS